MGLYAKLRGLGVVWEGRDCVCWGYARLGRDLGLEAVQEMRELCGGRGHDTR